MKQEISLQQKLILTPQLLLNLKLLALPVMELEQVLREEIEKNPCLEEVTEGEMVPEEETVEREEGRDEEFDYADLLPQEGYSLPTEKEEASEFSLPAPENPLEAIATLVRAKLPKEDYPYAEYILHTLDEDGFLTMSKEEFCQSLGITEEKLEKILEVIKSMEPGGIGAANRQEAFLIQLQKRGFSPTSLEYEIVKNFYESWLKMDHKKIAKETKRDLAEVNKALENLKILEPRPLRQYYSSPLTYIEPDFEVKMEGEKISVFFREEYLPNLRIAPHYREILNNPRAHTKEEVDFAKEKVRHALNLIRAIEERKALLYKVVSYIVEKQSLFFRTGQLSPLTVRDCAKELNLHPSIISRAVTRKYLSTPMGIFPLRHFLSPGMGEKSKADVKMRVKELIEKEDPSSPLTDAQIVRKLQEEGVKCARRTVVKYREELNIPSCRKRKREIGNKPRGEKSAG